MNEEIKKILELVGEAYGRLKVLENKSKVNNDKVNNDKVNNDNNIKSNKADLM